MSKMNYKKQSVKGLEYKLLLSTDLDYNFNTLENRLIEWQDISLNFSIIGSSHFVKINAANGKELTELLACVDSDDISSKKIIEQKKLANYHHYNYKRGIFLDYFYSFYTEAIEDHFMSDKEFKNRYSDNSCDTYLEYIFPSLDGLAITSIEIKREFEKILWTTYHSYPEEKMIIRTQSKIERRNGK